MLLQLPPELLRLVSAYSEAADLLRLLSSGDSLLTNRLTVGEGCGFLTLIAPYSIHERAKVVPKGLMRFRRLQAITLRPKLLHTPGNFQSTPGLDWVQVMPASLTQLSVTGREPLNSFFRPQIASLTFKTDGTRQILLQWAKLYERGVDDDPWLPLERLLPNLQSFEVSSPSRVHYSGYDHAEAMGHAVWRFLGHLPATLREFHSDVIQSSIGKWAAALPRNLESWSCPSSSDRSIGWGPNEGAVEIAGAPHTSGIQDAGLLASQVHYFPDTLTRITIYASLEVDSLAHFPSLLQLSCKTLIFAKDSKLALQGVPICSALPKTLTDLYLQYCIATTDELCTPLGRYPPQLLKLRCAFSTKLEKILPYFPPRLTSLDLGQGYVTLMDSDTGVLPRTLTSLICSVRQLPLSAYSYFPTTLRTLKVLYYSLGDQTEEGWSSLAFMSFPFLSDMEHLELYNTPPFELTNEVFPLMPNALELHLNEATIHERNIPKSRQTRLRLLDIDVIIVSGHGLCEDSQPYMVDEASPGLMTKGILESAFKAWLQNSDRVKVHNLKLHVSLERLPMGVTALKNLTWHSSEIEFLPTTLTELSGHFQLRYEDIAKLPKSIRALRDSKLIIDNKAAAEILSKISKLGNLHLSLPYDLYKECCTGTEIKNYISPHGTDSTASLSDDAMSKIWPEIETLVMADPFPLLTSECLKHIPRTLTKLRVLYQPCSSLMWPLVRELECLTSLTIIPRDHLIIEDLSHLPHVLQTLELNYDVKYGLSPQQKPEPQHLLHIPLSAISALPGSLKHLAILWPNDLPDSAIELLPRNLEGLKLHSPTMTDPPFHHFPTPLTAINIQSRFTKVNNLLDYLRKKRKASKPAVDPAQ